jgi:hypothetical protein
MMEAISSRKCENCGGALEALNADTLKRPYCGCTYALKSSEQPPAAGGKPSGPQSADAGPGEFNRSMSGGTSNGAKTLAVLFLIAIVVVVMLVIINQARVSRMQKLSLADTLRTDTGTALKLLTEDEEKEAHQPHVKKTYPEPEILITQHRIGMDEGMKVIYVGYRNKSKHNFLHVDFTIQLFDRQGREITVPDSDKTIQVYGVTGPGESKSEDYGRGQEIAGAKTVKLTLKKVALDSVVWDY